MRLTTLLFGSLAGFAIAAKLPDCAGSCISQAVKSTGCSSRDSQCICSHDSFESSVKQCTVSNCGQGKASGAAAFVADFCKSVKDLKKRHGGWQAKAKQIEHNGQQTGNYKGKRVTAPKYGKPSAPTYAYVASMTVWDSAPSATIYSPGNYPAATPFSNPWNVGSGHGGWPKANAQAAPSAAPSYAPSSNSWNVGSGHGSWPKANAKAAPSAAPSYAPSYRPMYRATNASAAPSVAPSSNAKR